MSLRRFSEIHDPAKLHNQLNRLVEDANGIANDQNKVLASHRQELNGLNNQIAELLRRVAALESQNA